MVRVHSRLGVYLDKNIFYKINNSILVFNIYSLNVFFYNIF
jgi:hypothetical protein